MNIAGGSTRVPAGREELPAPSGDFDHVPRD
jgi:hypothetical protein